MMKLKKEQKDKLAASRPNGAVQPCPKYEGRFLVVQSGSEEPAKDVRYRVRRPNGAVVEGVTGADGQTKPVKTSRPEILALELVDVDRTPLTKDDANPGP